MASGNHTLTVALQAANLGHLDRSPGLETNVGGFSDTPPAGREDALVGSVPPADAEAVKEPALRDQLGTNGSAGGKLPAGKETSWRPWRRASAAARKALTNSA